MFERLLRAVASRWFRLVLVLLVVLSFQTTLFGDLRPFGYAVQVLAIFVASAGVSHDLRIGMLVGLIAGFMYDAVLATPLGVSAIVFAMVGALGALFVQPFRDPPWWLRVMAVSLAAAGGEVLMPLMKSVVGLDGWLGLRVGAVAAVTLVGSLVLAWPLLAVSRWTLQEKMSLGR
jgi:rod shape-determining protein MreD